MTPAAFLAERLAELDRDALKSLATVAGVELKTARRAAARAIEIASGNTISRTVASPRPDFCSPL